MCARTAHRFAVFPRDKRRVNVKKKNRHRSWEILSKGMRENFSIVEGEEGKPRRWSSFDFRFESKCSECDQLGDKFRRWGTRLTCFLQSRSYAISSWYFLDWNVAHSCNFYFEKYNRFWIKYCIMWRIISAEIYIILKIISYS